MIDPNHPAVEAAVKGWFGTATGSDEGDMCAALTAALDHLTADDLPARLVRDIKVRTLRAAARAATYEGDATPWDHDLDRTAVWALLNEFADNIERDT